MIKEYIDKLPGGKEFITAERGLGMAIGATSMFMFSALIGLTVYGEVGAMLSRDSAIFILLVVSGFFWIILLVILIISYFYRINQADNIYIINSRLIVQEGKPG